MKLNKAQADHLVRHIEKMYPETKQQKLAIRKGRGVIGNMGRIYHAEVIRLIEGHVA